MGVRVYLKAVKLLYIIFNKYVITTNRLQNNLYTYLHSIHYNIII